ncbi:MAG: hypothetical protein PHQ95_00255 [Candidatus Gracilibacteria bacterium]|nr:hypothetical protein [Candidatus Gracilibacteria bacterium]
MKNLPIFKTLLVVFLIGIMALGFFASKKKPVAPNVAKTSVEATLSETGTSETLSPYEAEQKRLQKKTEDYAFYNTAVESLDITACDRIIGDDTLKTQCADNVYSAQASKEKDVTLCDKITDTTTKARCTNSFAYDSALVSGKQSDCDKITLDSDLKNACMKNIVFAKIENAGFSGTVDTCASLTGADKDYCVGRISKGTDIELLQKGINNKDIATCGQIQDTSMKNTCADTVYMTLALEKQDGSFCAKIIDAARKTNCTTQFARVNDANILSKALSENNLPLCATITTSELKAKCSDTLLLKTGVANRDTATCAKIVDTGARKQCDDAVKLILEQTNKSK